MMLIVQTDSGATYRFSQMGGRTYFTKGNFAGEVVSIRNSPICVGKSIEMIVINKGLKETDKKRPIRTTPVKTISASL